MRGECGEKGEVLVKNGVVKVNWKVSEEAWFTMGEGDEVCVRGFGGFRVKRIDGKRKKDKLKVRFELMR